MSATTHNTFKYRVNGGRQRQKSLNYVWYWLAVGPVVVVWHRVRHSDLINQQRKIMMTKWSSAWLASPPSDIATLSCQPLANLMSILHNFIWRLSENDNDYEEQTFVFFYFGNFHKSPLGLKVTFCFQNISWIRRECFSLIPVTKNYF